MSWHCGQDDERGRPLPELHGEPLVRALLDEIGEDERLGAALGIDLSGPVPEPRVTPGPVSLEVWLLRSEEIHRFLQAARRVERSRPW
ncbi:MAG: hypothetical protein HY744_08740 [Deltaproteobacteria bacterium]|nr:hypothetical protein [Deltaproteobacteria bacterium]